MIEVFSRQRPEIGSAWYEFGLCAARPGEISTLGGLQLRVDQDLDSLLQADTIVVPSWSVDDSDEDGEAVDAIKAAHARGARIVSICSGTFLLAKSGLLDGLSATTHWLYVDRLQSEFGMIEVDASALYVDEGQVVTAAGSAAGLDMLLHLIRRDHGTDACNIVANRLNIASHREGGQAQFAPKPVVEIHRSKFAETIQWMRLHANEHVTIKQLAKMAAMSPRTFFRKFKDTTGQTPYEWLTFERVALARDMLEQDDVNMDQVAYHAGFSSAETLRQNFKRVMGRNPSAYRHDRTDWLSAAAE